MQFSLDSLKGLKNIGFASSTQYTASQESEDIQGRKISQLSSTETLYEDDIFVLARKEQSTAYNSTNNITYGNLYEFLYAQLSARLLGDDNFISELSGKIQPVITTGTVVYNSAYPQG